MRFRKLRIAWSVVWGLLALLLVLLSFLIYHKVGGEHITGEPTVPFVPEDVEMETAISEAKANFKQFIEAYGHPKEKQTGFLVKVVFDEGERREHIWLADLDISGKKPSGVVANEPELPSLKFMQRVDFDPSYISDWMYIEDGYLVGGYTTRVIRDRMTPKERQRFDAQVPYKF